MHAASTLARKPVPLISENVMAFRVTVWRSSLSCQGSPVTELFGLPMLLLEAASILGDREMGRRKGVGRAPRGTLADVAIHEILAVSAAGKPGERSRLSERLCYAACMSFMTSRNTSARILL